MERFSFVFLVAGLLFFGLAFAVSGWIPMLPVQHLKVRTVEQLAAVPPASFSDLKDEYPEAFEQAFGGLSLTAAFAEALRVGHKAYIGEACWHCHSQQVRPWGNDEARYGRKSYPEEYHNELNMPPLWGTRRIGPDLIRRGGKRSNDWHVAHFYNPTDVSPVSVMPSYPWFFQADGLTPNKTGLSIIAYVQWLGSWEPGVEENLYEIPQLESRFPPADLDRPRQPKAPETPAAGAGQDIWAEEGSTP